MYAGQIKISRSVDRPGEGLCLIRLLPNQTQRVRVCSATARKWAGHRVTSGPVDRIGRFLAGQEKVKNYAVISSRVRQSDRQRQVAKS
jgi:hypothetical protein